jgi:hypothetical protein
MANKTQTIRIESILGGHSPFGPFASADQFGYSLGIDPDLGVINNSFAGLKPSGYIKPTPVRQFSEGSLASEVVWITPDVKNFNYTYLYAANGSVYSYDGSSITGLGDLTDGGTSNANGAAYNDNYIYFARDTTIARYGPLNGSPSFTDDYWTGVLGKTQLENPSMLILASRTSTKRPNHVMHRHNDGKLYFADTLAGQGIINVISTTKTTVEGDTDNGSMYNALDLPFGYHVSDIETFNDDLVMSVIETPTTQQSTLNSSPKLVFWDTISQSPNKVINFSFPDPIISAIINVAGTIYIFSGQAFQFGTRISRYIGGESFEQVAIIRDTYPPAPGGVAHTLSRIFFSGELYQTPSSTRRATIYALGSQYAQNMSMYSVMGSTQSTNAAYINALSFYKESSFSLLYPLFSWKDSSAGQYGLDGIDAANERYSIPYRWLSQTYKIGSKFKITKVKIPLTHTPSSLKTIQPFIYVDDFTTTYTGNTDAVPEINSTNFPQGKKVVDIRPISATGDFNFSIGFSWTGSAEIGIALPITIEYELIPD